LGGDYGVVGFTSTFNQNIASVTLAKLIKAKYPAIKILFGERLVLSSIDGICTTRYGQGS